MELTEKQVESVKGSLELLQAILNIEYHNRNWLPVWAVENPKDLNQEMRKLINRALWVLGTTSEQIHT